MTCTELKNEIKIFLDNQDDTFKENAKQLAKDAFGTSSLSRMKKAELQQYYEMLVALVEVEEEEEVIEETVDVELNQAVIKESIKTTLAAMNATLDNTTWTELHQRYLHLKSELKRLEAVG